MRRIIISMVLLIICSFLVTAVTGPLNYNSKQYYVVTSTDPTEDSGDEVCAKVGMKCMGYTEPTNAVCKLAHTGAADVSSVSGDLAGVYCNGAPQNGICATETDTCHTCPTCTATVTCSQTIGGLYREMYAECGTGQCKLAVTVSNFADLLNQIQGINQQLQGCPQAIPASASKLIKNGVTVVNVIRLNGQITALALTITNGQVNGISTTAPATCAQKITVAESDINTALQSSNLGQALTYLLGQKKVKVSGCTILTKIKFFVINPFVKIAAKKAAPNPPPPKPAPNCGQIGEQCDNRACFSGMCGAAKEQINGQWGFWHYKCIDQNTYTANCIGSGNSPAPWNCLVGPCP